MAIIFTEGFGTWGVPGTQHTSAAQWGRRYEHVTFGNSTSGNLVDGRHAGTTDYALAINNSATLGKNITPTGTVAVMGFAFYLSGGQSAQQVYFSDSTGTVIVSIAVAANGQVILQSGNTGSNTVYTSAAGLLTSSVWCYLELKIDTAIGGSIEFRKDGVTVTTVAHGMNPARSVARFYFRGDQSSSSKLIQDIYVLDGSGSAPQNNFLGDIRIETIRPTANGASQDFVPDAGSAFQRINEPASDEVGYVASDTVNHKSTFVHGDLATTTGTIIDVRPILSYARDGTGSRTMAGAARVGGTDYTTTTTSTPDPTVGVYKARDHSFPLNPATNAPWTIAEVNSAEFGFKIVS